MMGMELLRMLISARSDHIFRQGIRRFSAERYQISPRAVGSPVRASHIASHPLAESLIR